MYYTYSTIHVLHILYKLQKGKPEVFIGKQKLYKLSILKKQKSTHDKLNSVPTASVCCA